VIIPNKCWETRGEEAIFFKKTFLAENVKVRLIRKKIWIHDEGWHTYANALHISIYYV
jgi:hypothetical protein